MITVRTTGFDAAATGGSAAVESVAAVADSGKSAFVSREVAKSDRPELTAAKVIVSGGRGMGSAEAFKVLEPLADKLEQPWAHRVQRLTQATFLTIGKLVKQVRSLLQVCTSPSVAFRRDPAFGWYEGFQTIVAINKDPEAPIFSVADYGIVGDLFGNRAALVTGTGLI